MRLIDLDDPDANDWLAVNQFTVIENKTNRRPDVVIFVNGLPPASVALVGIGDRHSRDDWLSMGVDSNPRRPGIPT